MGSVYSWCANYFDKAENMMLQENEGGRMESGAGGHRRGSRVFAWTSRIGLPAMAAGCALTIGFPPAASYAQAVSPVAYAPETPTKEPLATMTPPAPAGPAPCGDLPDFLLTDCQLKWYGIRVLGA